MQRFEVFHTEVQKNHSGGLWLLANSEGGAAPEATALLHNQWGF